MTRHPGLALAILLALAGCRRGSDPGGGKPRPLKSATPAAGSAAVPSPATTASARELEEPPEQPSPAAGASKAFTLDEPSDVGPAGPAAASRAGVVFVTRKGEPLLAPLTRPLTRANRPGPTPIAALARAAEEFVPFGRAPAVDARTAYWIHKGRLLAAPLDGSAPPRVLESGARDGTRVAVSGGATPIVAYIAWKPEAEALVARLWSEGKHKLELSPSGAAANSVALVQSADTLVAISMEARTGMSPVHARVLRTAEWSLEEDVVVWVGGSTQPLTELTAVATPSGVSVFLPIERDASSFGLARIQVPLPPRMNTDVAWRMYPNGVDPAPVASAVICAKPAIAYVRPEQAAPRSPLELHLALLDEHGLGASTLVARGLSFVDVSLAGLEHGALIAYVADRRTWARTLRCKTATN
jgi:hypothetical protein